MLVGSGGSFRACRGGRGKGAGGYSSSVNEYRSRLGPTGVARSPARQASTKTSVMRGGEEPSRLRRYLCLYPAGRDWMRGCLDWTTARGGGKGGRGQRGRATRGKGAGRRTDALGLVCPRNLVELLGRHAVEPVGALVVLVVFILVVLAVVGAVVVVARGHELVLVVRLVVADLVDDGERRAAERHLRRASKAGRQLKCIRNGPRARRSRERERRTHDRRNNASDGDLAGAGRRPADVEAKFVLCVVGPREAREGRVGRAVRRGRRDGLV